jgi:hypothetical protein
MSEDDEPVIEVIGIFDNNDRRYGTDDIDVPPLCQTCVQRSAEGLTGVLCQLSWLDHVLTPEDEREPFSCHAYENKEGLQ